MGRAWAQFSQMCKQQRTGSKTDVLSCHNGKLTDVLMITAVHLEGVLGGFAIGFAVSQLTFKGAPN